MKVWSSPRIAPTSATDRNDGIRFAYTSISRPSTVSVVISNIPPGPVSWARTSAAVGMGGTVSLLVAGTISDLYYPRYADERRGRVVDPLLHPARRPARRPGPASRSAGGVPRRAAGLPGQGAAGAGGVGDRRVTAGSARRLSPRPATR